MGMRDADSRCHVIVPSGSPDRRTALRYRTVLRWARITRAGDAGLWRVRNISRSGMMLSTGQRPRKGEELFVELSETIGVAGQIAWSNGEACGLRLKTPIACRDLLRSLCAEQSMYGYRPLRLLVGRPAHLDVDGHVLPIVLLNLSHRGAGFALSHEVVPGTAIRLVTETGIHRRGLVRWCENGHAGAVLTEPFTPDQLESAMML